MSFTDDEDFKVVLVPSSDAASLSYWDSGLGIELQELRLIVERQTEAISLLTNAIMKIKTQLKK